MVSPQEHFGGTQQSLDSIYKHTKVPFELVYVDAGSPNHVQKYLAQAAAREDFTLVRTDHFLAPNQARNLGLSQVTTDYVVFVTNDIHVSTGWLEPLWQCAQETDAAVVCPLTSVGQSQSIHLASDKTRIAIDIQNEQSFADRACGLGDLSCLLVKRDTFKQIGYFDPRLLGAQAGLDFCFNIDRIDGQIFCETTSVVTHVPQKPNHWSDWAYFMLRWSDAWGLESLTHFSKKWDIDVAHYLRLRYSQLGQRRHQAFVYPLLHKLNSGGMPPLLEQLTIDLERWLNQALTDRYARSGYDAVGKIVHPAAASTQKVAPQSDTVTSVLRNAKVSLSETYPMPH
ncbi:MAG: glycosyltransferase [Cyanobacteria bacterium P01_A01_bin.137]